MFSALPPNMIWKGNELLGSRLVTHCSEGNAKTRSPSFSSTLLLALLCKWHSQQVLLKLQQHLCWAKMGQKA